MNEKMNLVNQTWVLVKACGEDKHLSWVDLYDMPTHRLNDLNQRLRIKRNNQLKEKGVTNKSKLWKET